VHGSHGKEDAWIVKLNSGGDTVWTRTLGGTGDDEVSAIITTPDGGYLVTGSTDSEDGDITDKRPYFNKDAWVMKLDGSGHLVWSKTFGSFGYDAGYSVIGTADGGWLVAGVAGNNNGDVTGYHGGGDVWVLKLDNHGDRQWAKSYGGSGWDEAHNIIAVPDGYVLAGLTNSADGDVTGYHKPTFIGSDILLVKIDLSGNKIWAKAFGGTHDETATGLAAAPDGYVVAGYTTSRDGDVTGNHGQFDIYNDMWVLKVNASGNIVWAKAFGGSHDDAATSITGTPDGGFVLTGATSSNDGDVTGNHNTDGNYDGWIVKLDAGGNKQWAKALGCSDDDASYCVTVNPDGYTISGTTLSMDGDISGRQKGQYDIWAVKLIVQ
jgi:WD40 repeat protein